MSECQNLIDNYVEWLRKETSFRAGQGHCEITTPFLDRHNDAIQIFTEQKGNLIRLSDDEYTLKDLRSTGFEVSTPKRNALLTSILNGFGIRLEGDELTVTAAAKDFSQKKHNLIQAILAINDLFALAEPHVLSLFKEDVGFFLETNDIQKFQDFKLAGKSGFDHRFDFALPKTRKHHARVLDAVNNLTKDQAVTLAWAATDVKSLREEPLDFLVFVNDVANQPSPDNLSALQAYEITPLLWSHRDESLPMLRNGAR